MGKLEYTPGPWKVEVRSTYGEFVRETHIISKDGSHIAEVSPVAIKANAKLISEAPLMLEILQELVKDHEAENKDVNKEFDTYWLAKQLINKLENE